MIPNDELDAEVLGPQLHEVDGLRVHLFADEELVLRLRVHRAHDHRHGLRSGGALVEEGGVRHLHARELADESLEVNQRLQAALRDLRLVRCVGGVPAGVLRQVPQDHSGNDRAVVALADEILRDYVLGEDLPGELERAGLADGAVGQVEGHLAAHGRRDRLRHQVVQVLHADGLAHLLDVRRRGAQVARSEEVARHQQFLQRVRRLVHRLRRWRCNGGPGGGGRRGHRRLRPRPRRHEGRDAARNRPRPHRGGVRGDKRRPAPHDCQ
mmetsp:Transcript_74236/g.215091  ORF Transcript_74236/g.215091 Transcript_74236/m.215091 type:complete len:268 (-) Transcript_74236:45-848(-)